MPYDEATSRDPQPAGQAGARAEVRPTAPEQRPRDPAPDSGPPRQSGDGQSKADEKKPRSPLVWIILALVLIAGAIGGVFWWLSTKDLASTDDAYTDGRAVMVTPKVSGYVLDLAVNDNQFVHAGDLLVQIDPRDYVTARDQARASLEIAQAQERSARLAAEVARKNFPARLAQAQAQVATARAQLFQAQSDYDRQHRVARDATTQQAIDQSTAALQSAEAQVQSAEAAVQQAEPVQQSIGETEQQVSQIEGQVDQARAQLAQADLNLSHTRVLAPQDGWVTKRNVERGNYMTVGTQIMSLVSPQVWVTANFKETQLNRMRPGQHVDIEVDAYPSLKLTGHVDSVQLGSGSRFSAFPAENATGNYVKIVQRVPVKIDIDGGLDPNLPLPLGISVEPTVSLK
jgi:membrane fusion protein (multidrug efflux system)